MSSRPVLGIDIYVYDIYNICAYSLLVQHTHTEKDRVFTAPISTVTIQDLEKKVLYFLFITNKKNHTYNMLFVCFFGNLLTGTYA